MKKLLTIIFFGLLLSGSAYAETIKKIHLICSFDKFESGPTMYTTIIPKDELSDATTGDKFVILEIRPNDNIKVLETSFWLISSVFEPEKRIIIPFEINDREIKFKIPRKSDTVNQIVTLNRRSGKLVYQFKNPVDQGNIYWSCLEKEKLF